MKRAAFVLAVCLFYERAAASQVAPVRLLTRSGDFTVFVKDEDVAADRLVSEVERLGGYLKERGNGRLVVRVPSPRFDEYLGQLASLGVVGERKILTRDVTQDMHLATTGQSSRSQMLQQYLESLGKTSNREDLSTIQGAAGQLIGEIEKAKGAERVFEHDMRYAKVDITFQKRERKPVRMSREENFKWLGTVGLNQLLSDFAQLPEEP